MCGTTNHHDVNLLLTNHTSIIVDVSRSAATRHYSSTPPSFGSRARNRIKLYQAEARRNRQLDNHVKTPDKIEQMKRKINGLVAGEKPIKEDEKNMNEKKRTPSIRQQKKFTSRNNKAARDDDDGVYYSDEKSHRVQERRTRKKKNPPVMMEPKYKPLEAPYSVFVSCLPGVEPLLLQEVQYLQSQWDTTATATDTTEFSTITSKKKGKATIIPGGVKFIIPSMAHIYILHLYLGTASHVYLRLNDNGVAGAYPIFRARGFSELKRKLKDMMISQQWNKLLLENSSHPLDLQVHVTTSKSKLMHTKAVEERVWETLGDIGIYKLRHADKSDDGGSRPIVRLLVRIDRDEVQVSLDTSSSSTAIPLHMRGYRLNPFKAPIREDLAFALLLAGGLKPAWNLKPLLPNNDGMKLGNDPKESYAASGIQLFDPLCGSGTIAIEGCSILAGLPPGRFRPAPLQGTSLCNPALWEVMKSKALSASLLASSTDEGKEENPSIILVAANDINQSAISAAKSNAKRAGVEQLIDFKVGSFKVHPLFQSTAKKPVFNLPHEQTLHVVTNPPFVGKRLSTPNESKSSTYKKLAKSMFSLPYKTRCTIIGNDPRLLRESSLPLDVAFSTKHGGLSVLAMTGQISESSI